jgi:hypothetical protein
MAPLRKPESFCVRSLEAAPELLPPLQQREAELRARGLDVRFIGGALTNVTAAHHPQTIVRYAQTAAGVSATTMAFEHVHVEGPRAISSRVVHTAAFAVRDVLEAALARDRAAVIALRLDIEGAEWWVLDALSRDAPLLCQISYLFVEYHNSATHKQRVTLPGYGLRDDAFNELKDRVHAAMERPGCRLRINWRSFWASCGDQQRFEWRDSPQVKGSTETP